MGIGKKRNPSGKQLTFLLEGPDELKGVKVKLHYALYDGCLVFPNGLRLKTGQVRISISILSS